MSRAVGPHGNGLCEDAEVLKRLAYSHTLKDMFQRAGVTRQRPFVLRQDKLRRHLFAETLSFRYQSVGVPSTVIPYRAPSSGNREILPQLTGGCEVPCPQPQAVSFA